MEALLLCFAIYSGGVSGNVNLNNTHMTTACLNTPHVVEASKKYNIDPTIMAALIWVESRWSPSAVSWANACGLTQVLPKYVKETCEELKDPVTSIYAGTRSLDKWIGKRKKRSVKEALACYNVGNKCLESKRGRRYSNLVLKKARWYTKEIEKYKTQKAKTPMKRMSNKELKPELIEMAKLILKKNRKSPYGTFALFRDSDNVYGCLIEEHYRPLDSKQKPRGKHKGCSLFVSTLE